MKESLWARNTTNGILSLKLHPVMGEISEGLAKHRVKRLAKAGIIHIRIAPHALVDLVRLSDLKISDIKQCEDYKSFILSGSLKVDVETHVVIVEDSDLDVVEVVEESILIEEPEEELELSEIDIVEEVPEKVEPPVIVFAPKSEKSNKRNKKGKGSKK